MDSTAALMRDVRRKWKAVAALVLAVGLYIPEHARAQDADASDGATRSELLAAQIESLVTTLKDDATREKFIGQLEVLLEAQRTRDTGRVGTESEGIGLLVLSFLSQKVEGLNRLVKETSRALANAPSLAARLVTQAADPNMRARWLDFLVKLILIVGAAFAVEWLVIRLLDRSRLHLRDREEDNAWLRTLFLLERTLIDLAPVGAFGVAAYTTLALADPRPETRVVALVIVNANLLVRATTVVARMILRPRYSTFRLVAFSDDTANYLFFWVRRLTVVSVYGFFIAEALVLLGLGHGPYAFAQKLVGLIVSAMTVMLVLQNRAPVRTWLAGAEPSVKGAWRRVRGSFAEIWHVFAIAYTVAIYVVWAIEFKGGFGFLLRATLVTLVTLVTAAMAMLALRGLQTALAHGFGVNEETRRRFPHLEERVNRYRGVVEVTARSIVVVIALLVVFDAWGLNTFSWLASEGGRQLVGHVLAIVFVTGAALVAWEGLARWLSTTSRIATRAARSCSGEPGSGPSCR